MIQRILLFAFIVLLASCSKEDNPLPPGALPEQTILNAGYGSNPAQKMDIYLPANRQENVTKVVVMIHGGGWTGGDKSEFTPYIDSLKRRLPGYAIFNINYRLATGSANFFPTQEQDVQAALDSIYARKATYSIGNKFVLLGASAGGHLALLRGYKNTAAYSVKAIVDFFGPTDFIAWYNNPPNPLAQLLLWQVTGGDPATKAGIYQEASPIRYVSSQSPPTIILQGGADIVVPPSQSALLKDKLQAMAIPFQYVYYPAESHGWGGTTMQDSFDKIQAFIAAHVN